MRELQASGGADDGDAGGRQGVDAAVQGREVQLDGDGIKARVESAAPMERLKAEYHRLLSTFAFNFIL
jgi:hypothetical protein